MCLIFLLSNTSLVSDSAALNSTSTGLSIESAKNCRRSPQ